MNIQCSASSSHRWSLLLISGLQLSSKVLPVKEKQFVWRFFETEKARNTKHAVKYGHTSCYKEQRNILEGMLIVYFPYLFGDSKTRKSRILQLLILQEKNTSCFFNNITYFSLNQNITGN